MPKIHDGQVFVTTAATQQINKLLKHSGARLVSLVKENDSLRGDSLELGLFKVAHEMAEANFFRAEHVLSKVSEWRAQGKTPEQITEMFSAYRPGAAAAATEKTSSVNPQGVAVSTPSMHNRAMEIAKVTSSINSQG